MELDAIESTNIPERLPLSLKSKDSNYDDDETDVIGPMRAQKTVFEGGEGLLV